MTGFRTGFAPGVSLGLVPGADALFAGLLQLAAGKPVFTADYYIIDPTSGKVLAFVDWNDPTHLLIQTTTALQVRPPAPSDRFNGRLAITNSLAAVQYTSNRAASAFRYLHDGTGCTVLHVFARSGSTSGFQALSATARNNAAVQGHNFYFNGGVTPAHLTRNGATTVFSGSSAAAGTGGTYATMDYQTSVECAAYTKSARTGLTVVNPPAATDPDRTLTILNGTVAPSDFYYQGEWAASAFTTLWSAATRSAWQEYLRAAYRITP